MTSLLHSSFCAAYIYLINQVRGPYWENIGPRADILPVRSRASLVNKRFITRLKKALKVFHKLRFPSWLLISRSYSVFPSLSWFTIIRRAFESFQFKAETGFLKVSHPFWSFTTKFSKDFVLVRHLNFKFKGTQVRDHSGQCPVQYLENIGPAIEHFDWLILVIGPLTARVM